MKTWNLVVSLLCVLGVSAVNSPAFADGTGADGVLNVTAGTFNLTTQTQQAGRGGVADAVNFSADASNGLINNADNSIILSAVPTGLAVNDEVLIINLKGASGDYANVGNYETKKISAINANTISFATAISNTYGDASTQKIMVQRVPNYTVVTIGAGTILTINNWNGVTGGVLAFRANGTVLVNNTGYISSIGKGHRGGIGVLIGGNAPSGETYIRDSYASGGAASQNGLATPNPGGGGGGAGITWSLSGGPTYSGSSGTTGPAGGGGGAGSGGGDAYGGGGGGGGYGSVGSGGASGISAGSNGSGSIGGTGGNTNNGYSPVYAGGAGGGGTYGDSTQLSNRAYLGAGGGAGGGTYANHTVPAWVAVLGGNGGNGGGLIFIAANTINVITGGGIQADGQQGTTGTGGTGGTGGGGGAGGSIFLRANTITSTGASGITAVGGGGGVGSYGGGAGGVGRICIAYLITFTGTSNPTAYTYQDYSLIGSVVVTTTNWTDVTQGKAVQMGQSTAQVKFEMKTLDGTARWKRFRIDKGVGIYANIACPDNKIEVQVWMENTGNGFWDIGDTLISKGNFTNGTCYLNMKQWQVTTTSKTYYIVYKLANDIGGGQRAGVKITDSSYLEFENATCVGVPP